MQRVLYWFSFFFSFLFVSFSDCEALVLQRIGLRGHWHCNFVSGFIDFIFSTFLFFSFFRVFGITIYYCQCIFMLDVSNQ